MTDSYKLEQGEWANHIVGHGDVSPEDLLPNELNYRVHPKNQQDAMVGALNEIGWIDSIIVNKRTSELWGPNDRFVETLVDGHLRAKLALRKGIATIPVTYVDLDPASERLALAVFDPIGAMAETDSTILDELLRDVNTGEAALQALLAELAEDAGLVEKEEKIKPPTEQEDKKAIRCPNCGHEFEVWTVERG